MPGAHCPGFHYFPAERNDFTGGNISITEAGSPENRKVAVPDRLGEGFARPLPPFRLNEQPSAISGSGSVLGVTGTGFVGKGFSRGQRLHTAFTPVGQGIIEFAL